MAFHRGNSVGGSQYQHFGAYHAAYHLALYASLLRLPSQRKSRFRAGGYPYPGGTPSHRDRSEGFRSAVPGYVISFPFPGLSRRTATAC